MRGHWHILRTWGLCFPASVPGGGELCQFLFFPQISSLFPSFMAVYRVRTKKGSHPELSPLEREELVSDTLSSHSLGRAGTPRPFS